VRTALARTPFEEIFAVEEEHAEDMLNFLAGVK
jgi:hypothetical protein